MNYRYTGLLALFVSEHCYQAKNFVYFIKSVVLLTYLQKKSVTVCQG